MMLLKMFMKFGSIALALIYKYIFLRLLGTVAVRTLHYGMEDIEHEISST